MFGRPSMWRLCESTFYRTFDCGDADMMVARSFRSCWRMISRRTRRYGKRLKTVLCRMKLRGLLQVHRSFRFVSWTLFEDHIYKDSSSSYLRGELNLTSENHWLLVGEVWDVAEDLLRLLAGCSCLE